MLGDLKSAAENGVNSQEFGSVHLYFALATYFAMTSLFPFYFAIILYVGDMHTGGQRTCDRGEIWVFGMK